MKQYKHRDEKYKVGLNIKNRQGRSGALNDRSNMFRQSTKEQSETLTFGENSYLLDMSQLKVDVKSGFKPVSNDAETLSQQDLEGFEENGVNNLGSMRYST